MFGRAGKAAAGDAATPVTLAATPATPPAALLCPITRDLMHDPCIATDGHTYERTAIETWLLQHDTSPMTGLALDDKWLLLSNLLARSLTHEWREINEPGHKHDVGTPCPLPCSLAARRYA
eukprot:COSAG02_NODE_21347_length_792_cov_0.878788_1_plen_120_part_10